MLKMHNISKVYRTDLVQTHALRDFSLNVAEGEFVAVTGPSGSGKTTFLNIAGMLESFESGTYMLDNEDVSGLNDDARYLQISAAVQPGNSGGAAIDGSGRVMGVVVSKLNALAVARITGDIPQNVNFAIKVAALVSFLDAHNVAYEADTVTRELSNTQRAERAEAGSVQVECRR